MRIVYVETPKRLPSPPPLGRVVTLDLAFAAKDRFEQATRPFIEALGLRLARWIDHHPHPAWERYRDDPRFLLVDKESAPASPELVHPGLVEEIGEVDHVFAHADFDGLLTAVKFLRKGVPAYEGADEDARAIDAPGRGFVCSDRGLRLADAIDQSRDAHPKSHQRFLLALTEALVRGVEPPALAARIDALAGEARERAARLLPLLDRARRDHPEILVLGLDRMLSPSDKKRLLVRLEERARVAVIEEPHAVTVATFDPRIRLTRHPLLHGTDGLAWGKARYHEIREGLISLLP
ncbi:MAG TPA: hypothetical protein VKY51_01290 [Fredinandcohnia sp.]|nr:hypothetical protein [Fredinandcohnia sp.]